MNNKVEGTNYNDKPNNSKVEQKDDDDEWAECDPNVGALITGGFIQKV